MRENCKQPLNQYLATTRQGTTSFHPTWRTISFSSSPSGPLPPHSDPRRNSQLEDSIGRPNSSTARNGPKTIARTTKSLYDQRFYNRNSENICSIECNLKHAITCSKAVYIKYIPYLGRRRLSTLAWFVVLNSHQTTSKAIKQGHLQQVIKGTINISFPSHTSPPQNTQHSNTQAHNNTTYKHIITQVLKQVNDNHTIHNSQIPSATPT